MTLPGHQRSGLWSEFARIIREVRPEFVFVENSPMLTSRGLGRVLGDLASLGFDAEWGVLGADDAGAPHIRKRIWILADADHQRELQQEGLKPESRGRPGHGGVESLPDSLRPRLPQSEQQALLRAWGGTERRATRELRGASLPHPDCELLDGGGSPGTGRGAEPPDGMRRPAQPGMGGMADGLAPWMDGPWAAEPADLPRVASGIKNRVGRLKAIGNGHVPQCAALAFTTLYRRLMR